MLELEKPASTNVLVVNCGSSSVKFSVVEPDSGEELALGLAERLGSSSARLSMTARGSPVERALPGAEHQSAMGAIVEELRRATVLDEVVAVGHRVVHGGETFRAPVVIDDGVLERVRQLSPLAPLHNPLNLLGIEAARAALPDRPHVAVFDTAFHGSMPAEAYLYAIPKRLYSSHGIRRYGFHGQSHEWVSREAARRLGRGDLGLITAHLGNGCSAAAVWEGRSVDTTMGLTPLEGLVMGTRSGDVDPGMLPLLGEIEGRDLEGVVDLLNRESGLLGLSGRSNDMRALLDARAEGDREAALAIDVFCHRLARAVGGLAAALERFDALVFTGGIGEHASAIRAETLARLKSFDFRVDPEANAEHGRATEGRISEPGSKLALVIPTNEERMIALHTAAVVPNRENN